MLDYQSVIIFGIVRKNMKNYINWSIFAAVGLLLAIGITIFHYFIFPIALHYQVSKTLHLENGTEVWEKFVDTPVPIIMKLYFFKLENPTQVKRGGKPNLTEVGPYVYREKWKKHEVRIDEGSDTVFYRQGVEFIFDQELSEGRSELDNITFLNPLLHLLPAVLEGMPTIELLDEVLEFALPELFGENYGITMTVTLRQLLFDGIVIPCAREGNNQATKLVCTALKYYQPTNNLELTSDGNILTTLLKFKEMGPLYQVSRGSKDISNIGRLVSVDGKTKGDKWWCESANQVAGFDMTMFQPFITRTTRLPIYISDIKTTVNLTYSEDSSLAGIDGYKFGMRFDLLGNAEDSPVARCYCPGSAKNMTVPRPCLPGRGVLDLTSPMDLPLYLSLPHFYQASENWQSKVIGLNPQAEKHESYVTIEPTSGVPLIGYRRMQINAWAKALPALRILKDHANAMVPLFWLEEGTSLGPKEISILKNQLLAVLKIVNIVRWTLFSVGLLMFVVGTSMAVWKKRQALSATELSEEE